jgi:hypothetical protein
LICAVAGAALVDERIQIDLRVPQFRALPMSGSAVRRRDQNRV